MNLIGMVVKDVEDFGLNYVEVDDVVVGED